MHLLVNLLLLLLHNATHMLRPHLLLLLWLHLPFLLLLLLSFTLLLPLALVISQSFDTRWNPDALIIKPLANCHLSAVGCDYRQAVSPLLAGLFAPQLFEGCGAHSTAIRQLHLKCCSIKQGGLLPTNDWEQTILPTLLRLLLLVWLRPLAGALLAGRLARLRWSRAAAGAFPDHLQHYSTAQQSSTAERHRTASTSQLVDGVQHVLMVWGVSNMSQALVLLVN